MTTYLENHVTRYSASDPYLLLSLGVERLCDIPEETWVELGTSAQPLLEHTAVVHHHRPLEHITENKVHPTTPFNTFSFQDCDILQSCM